MAKAKKTKSVKNPLKVWVVTRRHGDEVCTTIFRKEKDAVEHFDYTIAGVLGTEVTDDQVDAVIKDAREYNEFWYSDGNDTDGEVRLQTEWLH